MILLDTKSNADYYLLKLSPNQKLLMISKSANSIEQIVSWLKDVSFKEGKSFTII